MKSVLTALTMIAAATAAVAEDDDVQSIEQVAASTAAASEEFNSGTTSNTSIVDGGGAMMSGGFGSNATAVWSSSGSGSSEPTIIVNGEVISGSTAQYELLDVKSIGGGRLEVASRSGMEYSLYHIECVPLASALVDVGYSAKGLQALTQNPTLTSLERGTVEHAIAEEACT